MGLWEGCWEDWEGEYLQATGSGVSSPSLEAVRGDDPSPSPGRRGPAQHEWKSRFASHWEAERGWLSFRTGLLGQPWNAEGSHPRALVPFGWWRGETANLRAFSQAPRSMMG